MLSTPAYPLLAVISSWAQIAIILAIATIPIAVLIILIKGMQQQRHLRVALPWFVRSLVAVSVISLAIRGGAAVIGYLIFIVLPGSGIVGLLLGLIAAPIVSLVRRSFWTGGRISLSMVKGSVLAAVLIFAISCHLIGAPIFEELANLEEAGDSMLGITHHTLVLCLAVLPASLIGSLMGGISNAMLDG